MKALKLAYVVGDEHITAIITELIAKRSLHCRTMKKLVNGQQAFDQLAQTV